MTRRSPLADAGMSDDGVEAREHLLARVDAALGRAATGSDVVRWFVPGRIEVLGKHTDYAGGRSLICAVDRGFVVAAVPRDNADVSVIDVAGGRRALLALDPLLPEPSDAWLRYPATVFRRLARNFPDARRGLDVAFLSDLPLASGMSSSSAFMIAMFLAVAGLNRLEETAAYRGEIGSRESLASYLATIENGQSYGALTGDRGVGTFGGSEDHTAMLCARAGELSQYSFCPVRHERQVPFPADHVFVVAVSGIVAEKTGSARHAYNRASLAVGAILGAWRRVSGRADASLAEAVAAGAASQLTETLARANVGGFPVEALRARFEQFVEESVVLIPEAADALLSGDLARFGGLVDRSQHLAEALLGNQVPETIALAATARELGAVAASAFGAGFGGSVWAMVPTRDAGAFSAAWQSRYARQFPSAAPRASFLATRPGPPATKL